MRPTFLVLLLAAPMLAGCLGDDAGGDDAALAAPDLSALPPGSGYDPALLSEDRFGILDPVREYVEATMDGILLHAEVHLPDGEGPWPTILQLSPYNTHMPDALVDAFGFLPAGVGLVNTYVPKGYAVVIADVRGTGDSEGCMEMMGPKERQDAYDLVEWIAAQAWSDGHVGMQGVSYVGTTPHEALVMAPPHLDTVVTVAGVTNQWRNVYQNGVPYNFRFYPITYEVTEGLTPPNDVQRGPAWALNAADGACDQQPALEAMSPGTYEKGLYTDYWADRDMTTMTGNATASILYSQGFIDRAVNPIEAVAWFNDLPVPKKGLFHQEGHRYPPREDYFDLELAWFDYWLKGIENGVMEAPPVEVQLNDDRIRTGNTWPPAPAETTAKRLYLGPGALAGEPPANATEAYTAFNAGSGFVNLANFAAPVEETVATAAGAPHELVYLSPPLAEDLHLAGSAWMHLVAASDQENTYFLFDLVDVAPDGSQTWLAEGWFNAHLHQGFDTSTPLVPGEPTTFHFAFEPREYVLAAGHQVGVHLKGSDDGVFPFDQPLALNTVHYGAQGSWIELPVLADPIVWDRPSGI
ncbi:MAG: CocE/NonD family hydrolase [Thermoplasmatota archaeon]